MLYEDYHGGGREIEEYSCTHGGNEQKRGGGGERERERERREGEG